MEIDKMKNLLKEQKRIIGEYEKLVVDLSQDDLLNENIELKKELTDTKEKLKSIEEKYKKEIESNLSLKMALKDQMLNEKIAILNSSRRKIDMYFKDVTEKNENKLKQLEDITKKKIKEVEKVINSELEEEKEELFTKLKDVSNEVEKLVIEKQEKLTLNKTDILKTLELENEKLKNEELSEDIIKKKKKQNNLEGVCQVIGVNFFKFYIN